MGCDIAWCAGFLDGEGSFMFAKHASSRRPTVSADQVIRDPLDKLAATLGGSVSGPVAYTTAGRPIYRWLWRNGLLLRERLPELIPHLTIKREQAILLVEYAAVIWTRGSKLSDEELSRRSNIEARLRAVKAASAASIQHERGQ